MAGIYTIPTLATAIEDMGGRLYDPDHIHWSEAELTLYIQEAIRTYNALTNHYRIRTTFTVTPNEPFYDLPTTVPTYRANTITVSQVITQIAYMLLEPPPTGTFWRGTEQYSLEDIRDALQQARDTFLLETGVIVTRSQPVVTPAPSDGRVDLDEVIINLRRLAWKTSNGYVTVLRRDDDWALNAYAGGWQTASAATPKAYSVGTTPPLVVQLAPISTQTGTLDLLTINRGTTIDLADSTQLLGVPDDWVWVVIFGTLAQLFQRDGLALDVGRGSYCEARWNDGLARAKAAGVVLAARVDGAPLPLGSVSDADAYSTAWQMVPGVARRVLTMGQTLVGLWPPPGGASTAVVTLDLVRNAPVPVSQSDVIQIGQDVINDLLDYAQHLALVKEGSGQIQGAMTLLDQFTGLCGTTIDLQLASAPNDRSTVDQTSQDRRVVFYAEQES